MSSSSPSSRHVRSDRPDRTSELGRALGALARPGDVLCLWGDLGAGKTHLAKAIGVGLGVTETVTSPTFILMAEYEGRLPLFHVDLYRLGEATEVIDSGLLDDRWSRGVTLIEWPDRLGSALPPERLDIVIDGSADDPRDIRLTARGERHAHLLAAVA